MPVVPKMDRDNAAGIEYYSHLSAFCTFIWMACSNTSYHLNTQSYWALCFSAGQNVMGSLLSRNEGSSSLIQSQSWSSLVRVRVSMKVAVRVSSADVLIATSIVVQLARSAI